MSSTRGGGEPCLALIVHPLQVFADLALKHRRIARRRRAIAMAVEDNVRGRALSFLDAAAVCTMSRVCKVSHFPALAAGLPAAAASPCLATSCEARAGVV